MPEGFQVSTEQVAAAGRTVCELADALRSTRSGWDGSTRDGGSACGLDVVTTAYTSMQDAWFDEVGVHITILEQACQAVRDSAAAYRRTDDGAAEALSGGARADAV